MKCKLQIQPQAHSFNLGEGQLCLEGTDETLTWHDHCLRGSSIGTETETPTFGQPITEEGDVFLQSACIFRDAQLAAEAQSLLFGVLR